LLVVAASACTRDRLAASLYEGLQARECIRREGESYPHVGEDCRQQDYNAYRDERAHDPHLHEDPEPIR
jgi:hypothetical protein